MNNRVKALLIFFLAACGGCSAERKPTGFESARLAMVESQIEARGVKDTLVLAAMARVPRHLFVPESRRHLAYEDHPLPIGSGQTISQPYIVALMTEALGLKGGEKVLEIGTGSGYQAAVLAEICPRVFSIEIFKPLADRADSVLAALGYRNVQVRCGDGYLGWPEKAPFDAIIVTCAPPRVPRPLLDQLSEGGRLVAPLGEGGRVQMLTLFEKRGGKISERQLAEVLFVPMLGDSASGTSKAK